MGTGDRESLWKTQEEHGDRCDGAAYQAASLIRGVQVRVEICYRT